MNNNPFFCESTTAISFSGGRTSALMLRKILDAHGGELPAYVHVLFANTGKEREETLRFVRRCSVEWGVKIVWLEYAGKKAFREVDFFSASRKGEPFELLIKERSYLPNQVARFCTVELKIRTMHRYLRSAGLSDWLQMVGLRADEMHRVASIKAQKETKDERVCCPLADAGITKPDVLAYWAAAPFDLGLKGYEGNCDLCFLKRWKARLRMVEERPSSVEWWERMEREQGAVFRPKMPSYKALGESSRNQMRLPLYDAVEESELEAGSLDCARTD